MNTKKKMISKKQIPVSAEKGQKRKNKEHQYQKS